MGSLPVELSARSTLEKLGVRTPRVMRQSAGNDRLVDRMDDSVAVGATRERFDLICKVKPVDCLGELVDRFGASDVEAVGNRSAHQQPSVSGEDNPVLDNCDLDNFFVCEIILVERIKPKEPEESRKPP